ncbi:hypothetical protein Tco_0114720, partial [Tanacetum coccineum]
MLRPLGSEEGPSTGPSIGPSMGPSRGSDSNARKQSGGIEVSMEYLVKISKKARILELKRIYLKIIVLTSVSIKEDTAYMCMHFTKDHEGNKINAP